MRRRGLAAKVPLACTFSTTFFVWLRDTTTNHDLKRECRNKEIFARADGSSTTPTKVELRIYIYALVVVLHLWTRLDDVDFTVSNDAFDVLGGAEGAFDGDAGARDVGEKLFLRDGVPD